jgi:signal transduction histidine kinase
VAHLAWQHQKLCRRGSLIDAHRWCDDAGVHTAGLSRSPRAVAITAGGVLAMGVLVVLAVRADSQAPSVSPWLTAMDVAVGLAFVVAGLAARGPSPERVLVAAVGPAWLAGSFLVGARSLHQAILAAALVAFPAGRVRGIASWVLVGLTGLVALQLLPQLGVAALFTAIAAAALARWHTDPAAAWYPAAAAAAVAAVLAWVWWTTHLRAGTFDASEILLGYELVLLGVAGGFPVGAAAVLRQRARLADRLLSQEQLPGLDGLAAVLGDALGDRELRIYRWRAAEAAYVDGRGRPVAGRGDRRWLAVDSPDGPVAAVAHRSSALDDAPTAAAVAAAVRLAVTHLRLQEEQQERLRELEVSRARMVAAADRQRTRAAVELREGVQAPLRAAQSELHTLRAAIRDPKAAAAVDVVVQELAAATGEIADLVAGIPPADLGGGRLRRALHALAEASPVPVTVAVAEDAAGSREAETALFYVCCEALANAVKHAGATRVAIAVERRDGELVATIADDGGGGADPAGSGLQGLADRLATRKGRLRVDSPPGAGTTVTATIPG